MTRYPSQIYQAVQFRRIYIVIQGMFIYLLSGLIKHFRGGVSLKCEFIFIKLKSLSLR